MLKNNICKFIPESIIREQEIFNFIYEKNPDAMKNESTLSTNRLCLITRGEAVFNYKDRSVRCSAGDVLFLFEGECCSADPKESAEYMYISFKGIRYDELFRRFCITRERRHFSGFDGLIPLWTESLARAIDDNIDLVGAVSNANFRAFEAALFLCIEAKIQKIKKKASK